MILSDKDIRSAQRNHKLIEPFVDSNVQPASVDLTLGNKFVVWRQDPNMMGPAWDRYPETVVGRRFILEDEFMLATTFETVNISPQLVAQISGKSSWARKGLSVHITAGHLDPGFRGQVTLEMMNVGHEPIELNPGVRICQIVFSLLSSRAEFPYGSPGLGSHYQNQEGPQESALL